MKNVKKILRSFVIENYLFGESNGWMDDTSFMEEGIIDSTGVLELIDFLERTFSITFEDDELIPENLDSLVKVEKYLSIKCAGDHGA